MRYSELALLMASAATTAGMLWPESSLDALLMLRICHMPRPPMQAMNRVSNPMDSASFAASFI